MRPPPGLFGPGNKQGVRGQGGSLGLRISLHNHDEIVHPHDPGDSDRQLPGLALFSITEMEQHGACQPRKRVESRESRGFRYLLTLNESNGALGTRPGSFAGSGRREPVILLFLTVVLLALSGIGSLTPQLLLSRLHERQLARLPGSAPTL